MAKMESPLCSRIKVLSIWFSEMGNYVFTEDDLSDQFISESRLLFENIQAEVAPSAPSGLSAVASGASAIRLTWTDKSINEPRS